MAQTEAKAFVDTSPGEAPVRGVLHRAAAPADDALVLTHGASGNCGSQLLVMLAEALAASGLNVLRCDLPFRQLRPHGPPSPASAKRDQEGLRRAVTVLRNQFPGQVFLGGQSYGGRQASMLAASEPSLVNGLLLLSYPLHPPGKPGQPRTQHLPNLRTPTLFVSGSKDAFGSIEELKAAIQLIPAPTRMLPIPDAGHGLLTKSNRSSLPHAIAGAFRAMFLAQSP